MHVFCFCFILGSLDTMVSILRHVLRMFVQIDNMLSRSLKDVSAFSGNACDYYCTHSLGINLSTTTISIAILLATEFD